MKLVCRYMFFVLLVSAGLIFGEDGTPVTDRPAEDLARDADRRPMEILDFFGIEKGMRVAEIQSTTGYYTEILIPLLGPEGRLYIQNNQYVLARFAEKPLSERLTRRKAEGWNNFERIDAEVDEMELPEKLDAVLFIRFYHDLFWLPTPDGDQANRQQFLARVFQSLKPGGVFAVIDHHAEEGSGERDALDPRKGLHRIDAELVKKEVLAAGFRLEAESDLLRNTDDTRDWNIFSENRRDKTDRFVYRFVKPK